MVEELLPPQPHARCLGGERAGPPEDCGGPWGYEHLLEAIADPRHESHADMREWLGRAWDAELVDIEGIDWVLATMR